MAGLRVATNLSFRPQWRDLSGVPRSKTCAAILQGDPSSLRSVGMTDLGGLCRDDRLGWALSDRMTDFVVNLIRAVSLIC